MTFMQHALAVAGALLVWCAHIYVKPGKTCRKCSGWGQRQRRRKLDARAAMLEASRPARHAAILAAERPQVTQATQLSAIVNHNYHGPSIHIHGGGHEEAASLIRRALTGGNLES